MVLVTVMGSKSISTFLPCACFGRMNPNAVREWL
jgi:hypothetical protein